MLFGKFYCTAWFFCLDWSRFNQLLRNMAEVSLNVQTRDKNLKAKEILASGLLPLEYYGRGVENRSLQVDYQDFRRVFRNAGYNTVIELVVDGKDKLNVLVHEVKLAPVTDKMTHVDLVNVRMDEEIHTQIPLEFVGVAPAVKELAGTLMTHLNELSVKCLPKDLVHSIEVSLESLVDFNSTIHVADVKVPDSIAVINDPEELVATVAAPREEEPEEPVEGAEGAEEGAEGEEKKEEGGDATEGEEKKEEGGE